MPTDQGRKPFFLTTSWDDGSKYDFRVAELLIKYGLPGTFYIARSSEYRGLSDVEIRELGASFEVGAHTLNHLMLNSVSDDEAAAEIVGSKLWIEETWGAPCHMFCFPRGKFNSRHLKLVQGAGFRGVRTTELMWMEGPRYASGLAIMPTTIQAFPHSVADYLRNMGRRLAVRNLGTYALYGRKANWVAAATALLHRVSVTGGVFHLWGHSWELQQLDLWSDLESLFQVAAEYGCLGRFRTNSQLC